MVEHEGRVDVAHVEDQIDPGEGAIDAGIEIGVRVREVSVGDQADSQRDPWLGRFCSVG